MSGMRLGDLDFSRLLPAFMRNDSAVQALSGAINDIIPELSDSVKTLTTWDHIEDMSERDLDDLAWELNILWYDKSASLEVKRDLVLNSDKVYKRLGTKWAVENVIQTYFGDGYIQEWFEYEDGNPGFFRVLSTNPTLNNERLNEFLNILEKVKRHSSKLEGIYITLTAELKLSSGMAVREAGMETYGIGNRPITT